jgi:hypothetical protein
VKIVKKQRKQIKYLQKKLATAKTVQKQTKKFVEIEQDWTGEESTMPTVSPSSERCSSSQGTSS